MYALVDCNNFFVSCERAFQPELEGRAVVVLSNNDGCVVARSNESKAMGIKMGTPFFQLRGLVDNGSLIVRSSNYKLYGDLSDRVMGILREAAPKIEVYSIDEAFLCMDGVPDSGLKPFCEELVRKIRRWTGIPVSIGIAPTKTLAKVANHFAKKYPGYRGVCLMDTEQKRQKALSLSPVDDIWGIGWRSAPKLMSMGVNTALDFVSRPRVWVQKHMGVGGVRTWLELQGERAVKEEKQDRRQSICTSRSFAQTIPDIEELSLRISDFAGVCAQKLRREGSLACSVGVFIHTNPFAAEGTPQYRPYRAIPLEVPSASTHEVVSVALRVLRDIYESGYQYKRAGVVIENTIPAEYCQTFLFDDNAELRRRENLISGIMDDVNGPGKNLLRLGTQRAGHYSEGIRRDFCSRLYSTDWNELMEIH